MREPNIDKKWWMIGTIGAAVIVCIGAIIAAIITKPNFFGPKTLPTSTSNIQPTSAPFGVPSPTPFSPQGRSHIGCSY
jgi:hypothetical protein